MDALRPTESPGQAPRNFHPEVQFYEFPEATSRNEWRAVAGKNQTFPLLIRSSTWIYDMKLEQGKKQSLPVGNSICLVHLFDGALRVNDDMAIQKGESFVVEDEEIQLTATEDSDIVLFITDEKARVFKEGMYSAITKNTFIEELQKQNINVAFRTNDQGYTYGVPYIDNNNKTVFNGSDLGKAYSAKAIVDRFSTTDKK
ncbi:hypothetical protein [Mucilaginibacter sp. L196]|uniref:pirin family protein n=1 Tax=Mucilaginibacter sp. L196 TaxID=1641870 RepID=UPI00131C1FE9|nr:hypothetical protein [Mucilaginibacter sp. L196]